MKTDIVKVSKYEKALAAPKERDADAAPRRADQAKREIDLYLSQLDLDCAKLEEELHLRSSTFPLDLNRIADLLETKFIKRRRIQYLSELRTAMFD